MKASTEGKSEGSEREGLPSSAVCQAGARLPVPLVVRRLPHPCQKISSLGHTTPILQSGFIFEISIRLRLGGSPMVRVENKGVLYRFVQEVINHGNLARAEEFLALT